jgi:hypothetical protein
MTQLFCKLRPSIGLMCAVSLSALLLGCASDPAKPAVALADSQVTDRDCFSTGSNIAARRVDCRANKGVKVKSAADLEALGDLNDGIKPPPTVPRN